MQLDQPPRSRTPRHRGAGRRGRSTRIALVSVATAVALAASLGLTIKEDSSASGHPLAIPGNAAPAAAATKPTVPKGWKLTFDATFTGTELNKKLWSTCYYWSPDGCTNNPKLEKEWYLPAQVVVSGGALHLVAKHTSTPGLAPDGKPETYTCRSGMVTSEPGFNFKYGLVQITARIPYNTGLWPALWLSASNHQWPPEIDMLEHWHFDQQAKVYLHPKGADEIGGPVFTPGNLSTGWHTFQLYWSKNLLVWYIDGVQVFSASANIPQQDMYIIANLADDSTAPGSCTGTMLIKSVKVWQP